MAQGYIEINQELCKGCEFCTVVCPYELINMAGDYNSRGYRPAVFAGPQERCTGCTLCAMICPEAAITVFREVIIKSAANGSRLAPAGVSRGGS